MKKRIDIEANYKANFFNGKTIRQRINPLLPITTPLFAEIEDIAINSLCYANCFVGNSPIRMADDSIKNIEEIVKGDIVKSFNETTKCFENREVYELFKNTYQGDLIEIILETVCVISCTPNHKFLTKRGWVEAKVLTITDTLLNSYSKDIKIVHLSKRKFDGYVYNFSVMNNHNYLVSDVVVSNCHYCYTSATKHGSNFENIIEKAEEVWNIPDNNKPFQIAIGGAGEATIHPLFVDFIKKVNELGIMPNYTTNGQHLSDKIIKGTLDYCGGVALSYHPHIHKVFENSMDKLKVLKDNNVKLNTHVIIGDKKSLEDLKNIYYVYNKQIDYFVVLPYQAVGRAISIDTEDVWRETFLWINSLPDKNKFAFGALFYEYMLNNEIPLSLSIYEPEIYSGYRMFDDSYKILRKSSYNLEPKYEKDFIYIRS